MEIDVLVLNTKIAKPLGIKREYLEDKVSEIKPNSKTKISEISIQL
jgi:hypothetical protein